jgi:hypothetical protein
MLQTRFLFEVVNQNLLLGFIPESLGLFIFGIGLIVLAFGLRWLLKRIETEEVEPKAKEVN